MQKYIRKELISDDYTKEDRKTISKQTVTVKQVKKDTEIDTEYGPAIITAGNYIVTDQDKKQVGMTPQDFERQYGEWNS